MSPRSDLTPSRPSSGPPCMHVSDEAPDKDYENAKRERERKCAVEMLEAITKNWYSLDFDVYDRAGAHIGVVDLSNWSEKAELEVGGTSYEATHKSTSKDFVLSSPDGAQLLVAEKPSAWKERLVFEYGGSRYELKPESSWRRDFILTREGFEQVGSLRPASGSKRGWTAELPEELPAEIKLFVMWLVRLLWQRAQTSP